MNAIRIVAALVGLLTADLCSGQAHSGVDIEVSRDHFVVVVADPRRLTESVLDAVSTSQRYSQENPGDYWDEALDGPNWIRLRFTPARLLWRYWGPVTPAPVTEIIVSFPTRERGRRWPEYILLKTDTEVLSLAKWSHDQMCRIAVDAGFDPASIAPFDTRCADGVSE